MSQATRRIGIDAGHRVTRHESKCRHVHGHRYEVEITVEGELDHAGRVLDFGCLKDVVGGWLMDSMDHGYIAAPWDEVADQLEASGFKVYRMPDGMEPTAENIASHVMVQARILLADRGIRVTHVRVYETPSCWADCVG